jgi:signal transduction histidine kinase
LILASVLWTAGLLAEIHMLTRILLHVFPGANGTHAAGPILAGLVCMAAGLFGLRQALVPFRQLREKLMAVRIGGDRRVEGTYFNEVQPLIDELNALLEDREQAVKRAVATAGDLAHGLKTPLALLAQEAERAGAAGNPELAGSIAEQAERMSRQVNYHLARARAAASGASGAARCPVAACAEALIRALLKLHADRALEISSSIAPQLCARVQREDLDEILGNLLDNSCKWANSKIALGATRIDNTLVLTIDDDGTGLARDLRAVVLERGVRIDEAAPGSGLGLAIVRDLAELYGGSISLDDSPLGGASGHSRWAFSKYQYIPCRLCFNGVCPSRRSALPCSSLSRNCAGCTSSAGLEPRRNAAPCALRCCWIR